MARTAYGEAEVIALATREPLALERDGGWRGTAVTLPDGIWTDNLSGRTYSGRVPMAALCAELPVALLSR